MAQRVCDFDWRKTPLGPIETWSDTLITTLNLLLASRHPVFLWWGPDLIQFYNDGYRPSLRDDKHPSALGQRGAECWPEIWPIIGPQIRAVMDRGESTWNTNQLVPINRNGRPEEVFWTYSYSPVPDKEGTVQGTLVVCSETTEQVLVERRLRTLLAIAGDSPSQDQLPEAASLLPFARSLVSKLEDDSADIPFAALYLSIEGKTYSAASNSAVDDLVSPARWPVAEVMQSQTPLLVEDLQSRFGDLILEPWPEPVRKAYLLPLPMPGLSIQAVLLCGLSPRLPFDDRYQSFIRLLGERIASLLQSEIHILERAQAAKRFRRLAEANPFGMVIGSLHGDLDYMNPAFLRTLGYAEFDAGSQDFRWDDLTPPEYAAADAQAIRQLRESGRCDVYEKVYIAKDGRRVPVLVGASIIEPSSTEPQVAAFVTDLTPLKSAEEALRRANDELEKKVAERTAALETEVSDRKRAEQSLRELSGRLLRTQDEERRHMARELHDHAGQTLVALGLNFAALKNAAQGRDEKILGLVAESQKLSEDLSREIRTLTYLLHPPLLDEVGLRSALRWYVEGFSKRSQIEVALVLPEEMTRLPKDLELLIFRVVQESLTNVHRHSGSSSAKILLTQTENLVEFEISDRGKGIFPERQKEMAAARTGVGVRGMEERMRQFGGRLRIISDSTGTKVVGMIPLTAGS